MYRYTQLPHDTWNKPERGGGHLSYFVDSFFPLARREVYQVFDYKLAIACAKIRIIIIKNARVFFILPISIKSVGFVG